MSTRHDGLDEEDLLRSRPMFGRSYPVKPFFCLAYLSLLAAGSWAHATPFTLSGVLQSGTIGGTVNVDTVAGTFTSADVLFTQSNGSQATFTNVSGQYAINVGQLTGGYEGFFSDGAGDTLTLAVFPPQVYNLIGFEGSALCQYTNPLCSQGRNGGSRSLITLGSTGMGDYFLSGSLLPAATAMTPEPSSLLLFATGVLGVAGVVRRRVVKSFDRE